MANRARAAAIILALGGVAWFLLPVGAAAKGLGGHGFGGHGFGRHHGVHHHHHRGAWPYGGGPYGGWIAAYPDNGEPVIAIPAVISPTYSVAPRCTPSVETVSVPSENGGERKITITRCPR